MSVEIGGFGARLFGTQDLPQEGEGLVFWELDKRFPYKVAVDRRGEAMELAFGLELMKNERTEARTGSARLVFTRVCRKTVWNFRL